MINYCDVRDRMPEIGVTVKVFYESSAYGGHGLWYFGKRISKTHFQIGSNKYFIIMADLTNRESLGIGVTHWANINEDNLPKLCRLHTGDC